jgi:Mn-dependent DtxR family transcriptional regulator
MKLITEYLIIIERHSSEAFYSLCDNADGFNKLLQGDPAIEVGDGHIIHKGSLEFSYEITTGSVEGKEQRFFHVKVVFDGEEAELDEYSALLKSLKGIVHRAGGQPETLRDDVSSYFSHKSYPLIHSVENLMRRLITYFMLTNVGKEWVSEASPRSVREAIDKSKRKQYADVLHQIDFIQLGEFLFRPYQTRDVSELYQSLEDAATITDLNLDELKEFRAKSNWERYFSNVVACEDKYLDKRWDQLYELRCMIAHNAIVTRSDYERIVQLTDDVSEHLQNAIANLDKVHVPTEEKDQVAENVASNIDSLYGSFIHSWKSLEATLIKAGGNTKYSARPQSVASMLHELHVKGLIDDEQLSEGKELTLFRNRLLHDASTSFSAQDIGTNIARLETYTRTLKRSWKDEVVDALRALGGRASLSDIYSYIERNTSRKLADTWRATVRHTLQIYSSDTETYKGGEDIFQRLDKGSWALRTNGHDVT